MNQDAEPWEKVVSFAYSLTAVGMGEKIAEVVSSLANWGEFVPLLERFGIDLEDDTEDLRLSFIIKDIDLDGKDELFYFDFTLDEDDNVDRLFYRCCYYDVANNQMKICDESDNRNIPIYAKDDFYVKSNFFGDGKDYLMVFDKDSNFKKLIGKSLNSNPVFDSPDYIELINFNGNSLADILVQKGDNTKIFEYDYGTNTFKQILNVVGFIKSNDRVISTKAIKYLDDSPGDAWEIDLKDLRNYAFGTYEYVHKTVGLITGDVNGDGLTDIICPTSKKIIYSTGKKFLVGYFDFGIEKKKLFKEYLIPFDVNGDGYDDLLTLDFNITSSTSIKVNDEALLVSGILGGIFGQYATDLFTDNKIEHTGTMSNFRIKWFLN